MEAVDNPTFSMSDVNLKFQQTEQIFLLIIEKQSLGISVVILRKHLAFLNWQRFGYFMKKENNTKSLDSLINKIVQNH
jgi:hypothetical protein